MAGFGDDVLITGGAGFLGRGIIRYIQSQHYKTRITVYSRDEHKHYQLRARYPHVRTVLGDVTDADRLAAVMAGHDTVIHAAALKHVPEAERDASEAIRINVGGSLAVARAAVRAGVRNVIGISTDKVCSPRNTYGATKMLMERAFQEAQRHAPQTRFSIARYGNVVSSTGSVVPLFVTQAKTGMVSLTSTEMTRFWFGVNDAVRLIEYALNDTRRGSTYIAQCPAAPIMVVALAAWRLAGRCDDLQWRLIGTRPGEKLHETLVDAYEAPYAEFDPYPAYYVVPAATALAGAPVSAVMPYSSDTPTRRLMVDDMLALIDEAESL